MKIEHIVCIDDDKITLRLCEYTLKKCELPTHIQLCDSAEKAIEYLNQLPPVKKTLPILILLDLNMPGMNGWDFLEHFQQHMVSNMPECKVAILTSSINPNDRIQSKRYSCVVDFIVKPLEQRHVIEFDKYFLA